MSQRHHRQLAVDIGYSNLKIAYGDADKRAPITAVLPACAAPESSLSDVEQEIGMDQMYRVLVGNEPWVACAQPGRLQGVSRELHQDYPSTATYRALLYAAFLYAGAESVETLVTGLPVDQYKDKALRTALSHRFCGRHVLGHGRECTVKRVIVTAQPSGGFRDAAFTTDDPHLFDEGRVLVLDPGWYSIDSALYEGGMIRLQSSGSSLFAMSSLLESVSATIKDRYDAKVGKEKLERSIREGQTAHLVFGSPVELKPLLEEASLQVAVTAMSELRAAMRFDTDAIDLIVLVGGGAEYYRNAVRQAFGDKQQILIPAHPVCSNVRGYWHAGVYARPEAA